MDLRAALPITFVPTRDAARARAFYEGVLGLRVVADDAWALVLELGGGILLRVQKVPPFSPHPFTQLGWHVKGLDRLVADLGARGVVFERYAHITQDTHGVWTAPGGTRVVWFKDPDGNLLSLTASDEAARV